MERGKGKEENSAMIFAHFYFAIYEEKKSEEGSPDKRVFGSGKPVTLLVFPSFEFVFSSVEFFPLRAFHI